MLDMLSYSDWILHALLWLPFAGMAHVLWVPEQRAKTVALGWSLVVFTLSLGLWWAYDPTLGQGGFQLDSTRPWIAAWGVS